MVKTITSQSNTVMYLLVVKVIVILFLRGPLRGTVNAPAVEPLRLNTLSGTKTAFLPLKGTMSTPSFLYGSPFPSCPNAVGSVMLLLNICTF